MFVRYVDVMLEAIETANKLVNAIGEVFEIIRALHALLVEQRGNFILTLLTIVAPIAGALQYIR